MAAGGMLVIEQRGYHDRSLLGSPALHVALAAAALAAVLLVVGA